MSLASKYAAFLSGLCLASCSVDGGNTQGHLIEGGGISVVSGIDEVSVNSAAEDADGHLWLSSHLGLFRHDGTTFLRFGHSGNPGSLASQFTTRVYCDSKGRVFVCTQKGIDLWDAEAHSFMHCSQHEPLNFSANIFEDGRGRVFAQTDQSLLEYDEAAGEFVPRLAIDSLQTVKAYANSAGEVFLLSKGAIRAYDASFRLTGEEASPYDGGLEAFDGETLWLSTSRGIASYNTLSRSYATLPPSLSSIRPSSVEFLGFLAKGQIVIVSDGRTLCYDEAMGRLLSEEDNAFPFRLLAGENPRGFVSRCRDGRVWTAGENGGIRSYSPRDNAAPEGRLIDYISGRGEQIVRCGDGLWSILDNEIIVRGSVFDNSLSTCPLSSLIGADGNTTHRLYSSGDGRLFVTGGSKVFELAADAGGSLSVRKVLRVDSARGVFVAADKAGGAWVSSGPKIYGFRADGGQVVLPIDVGGIPDTYATAAAVLHDGTVVFGMNNVGFVMVDPVAEACATVPMPMGQFYISSFHEDADGALLVATSDHGLYEYWPGDGTLGKCGFFDDEWICNVCADADGRLVVCTDKAVFRRGADGAFECIWRVPGGLPSYSINFFSLPGGEYVRCDRKFSMLAKSGTAVSPPAISEVLLCRGDEVFGIVAAGSGADARLGGLAGSVDVVLSCVDSWGGSGFLYQIFKDGHWSDSFEPKFSLYDLRPGRNRVGFRARSVTTGESGGQVTVLIRVPRPLLFSHVAILCYCMSLAVMLWFMAKSLLDARARRNEAAEARLEAEAQNRLNMSNMDFFSNISHEFRTPLTLICGAAESLAPEDRYAAIIKRNAARMQRLVGQLMDFNRLEHDTLRLSVCIADVSAVTHGAFGSFGFLSTQKDMEVSCEGFERPLLMWVDADKYEKVLLNVLSNAFKYTPAGGQVRLKGGVASAAGIPGLFGVSPKDVDRGSWLCVSVEDSGPGIPEEMLERVFDRFTRAGGNALGGVGIGLYYCRALLRVHHGFIRAANVEGGGSRFSFAIPMDAGAYSEEEKAPRNADYAQNVDAMPTTEPAAAARVPDSDNVKILVIDDDCEMVYYLKELLSRQYAVLVSFDAMSGLKLIGEERPDIVVSDVMMPEVDGLKLCWMIKDNIATCHIPVILLSAKATVGDQVSGLDCGADAYVVKPFSPDVLLALIRSTLTNREAIRKAVLGMNDPRREDGKLPGKLSVRDRRLLDTLYAVMEENVMSPELDLKDLCVRLGLSRTNLFYKVKALTGRSPNDFFKVFRLNKALKLLKEGKYKIAAVSDMTGFSTPSHFTASFRRQFGCLPSDIRQETQNDDDI